MRHDILVKKYNILFTPYILSKIIEEELRREAYIKCQKWLEYNINQVEIDINEIYTFILNFGCFFP